MLFLLFSYSEVEQGFGVQRGLILGWDEEGNDYEIHTGIF